MTRRFRIVSIKPKSRWRARWRGWSHVVLALVHEDPNDWEVFGQVRLDVRSSEIGSFGVGDIINVRFGGLV